ncbi:MAG TPA: efflux RND transporter permease subunit [Patescibacteria group bacterium]|nr:efflux RND transporter permease subunit [Patescibacteria group bacterium]
MINHIIDYALKNKLLVLLLTGLMSAIGLFVYQQLPKDIYPDLNAPLVNVITSCPGMAAEDVERLITFPLESLMNGTPHVTRVRSESTTGESVVTVEFDWGVDIYLARQIVAGKLEIVAEQLPLGASRPIMGPVSSRMGEIFECAVSGGGVDAMELRSIADWNIRYRLLGVEGVSFVINLGGFVRQYQVLLKPELLHHYGISIAEVREAIEKSNRNFSGGIITGKNQEFLIKGLGRIETMQHLEKAVITSRNNIPVFVKDVAEVKESGKFRRGDAGFNGAEAVSITIQKQYGGDTLKAIENIKGALGNIQRDLPPGVKVTPYYDQSNLILSSLRHVEISMLIGGLLVVLVILFFLGHWRTSLIASLTIPLSVLMALIFMDMGGVSLTVMALGGLAIGIGKMASGSVIMVENIFKALQNDKNSSPTDMLVAGAAKEIGSYLFSANLIIILVFIPLLLLEGIAGRMFRPTAFAVAAALFGSLVINITVKPILMTYGWKKRRKLTGENRFVKAASRFYARLLDAAFRHKKNVLLAGLGILLVGGACFLFLGREFVPYVDEGSIIASTVMLPETSLEESVRTGKQVERIMLSFPEVQSVCRTTGMAEESEHVHPVNHSHYLIELKPRQQRKRDFMALAEAMRRKLDHIPGIVYMFEQPIGNKMAEMLTGAEGQISIKLFGPDLDVLNEKIREIHDILHGKPGIADLQIEQTSGIPQVIIRLDREALARHGLKVDEVADVIETALNGIEVTDVYEKDRITSVLVRLPESYRRESEAIRNLLVDTPSGQSIPLSQLGQIELGEGPQTIFRENMQKRKIIICNLTGRHIGEFVTEAKALIARQVKLPKGYYVTFGGQFESQQQTMRQLTWMMAIVGLGVLVILFASLKSLRQSLILLLNIPMTMAGGAVALLLAGQTLNVSSIIGFIALFGIALQNGVVLVGKINDLRRGGLELHQALVEGSHARFRPILMTELILILGVLPLAVGGSSGSEIHRPLAIVYIGGFLVAIFFEQILLPIIYEMAAGFKKERFLEEQGK